MVVRLQSSSACGVTRHLITRAVALSGSNSSSLSPDPGPHHLGYHPHLRLRPQVPDSSLGEVAEFPAFIALDIAGIRAVGLIGVLPAAGLYRRGIPMTSGTRARTHLSGALAE